MGGVFLWLKLVLTGEKRDLEEYRLEGIFYALEKGDCN